jgi:hypothetical protein
LHFPLEDGRGQWSSDLIEYDANGGFPQHLTRGEEVAAFVVAAALLWFLYSARFFSWVLDEQKRTQVVVFPGAVVILIALLVWITARGNNPVKAQGSAQLSNQSTHVRKHHPAPKATPPPLPPPDDDPRKLNYDYELPRRNPSAPVFLETSYAPATKAAAPSIAG